MTTEYVCCGYGHVANIGNASDINNIAVDCGKKTRTNVWVDSHQVLAVSRVLLMCWEYGHRFVCD